MDAQNRIQLKEEIGRDKAIKLLEPFFSIIKAEKEDRFDLIIENKKGQKALVEIKDLAYTSTTFKSWIYEVEKHNILKFIGLEKQIKNIRYINHFSDNITAIWDINKLKITDIEVKEISLPYISYSDSKKSKNIKKWVFLLPIEKAIKMETTTGKIINE